MLATGHVDTPTGSRYAYGFMVADEGGVRWFGHGGDAPGMNGDLRIFPLSGYPVAVLSNFGPPAADRIVSYVGKRLPDK